MRRSTTSVATERQFLGLLLLAELTAAVTLVWPSEAASVAVNTPPAAPVAVNTPIASTTTVNLSDGRSATVMALGGAGTASLTTRLAAEMNGAADAVTAFWGEDWPRHVDIVATSNAEEFRAMVGEDSGSAIDIAAATTAKRIVFAPGAEAMSDGSLRIVLRHELFHYAARADTAADAPRWLTEGVADLVGRPPSPRPGLARAAELARLPTDAELDTAGATRTLAYDRGWWFSRFVAQQYGPATLRRLYVEACGQGHDDAGTTIRNVLGADRDSVLVAWRRWLSG